MNSITKNNITKKSVMDGYQQILLAIDEMIDTGIVINTDSEDLEAKIFFREGRGGDSSSSLGSGSGLSFYSMFKSAKDNLVKSIQR